MRRVAFCLLLLTGLAAAADEMILVYPGKPGTQEQAKNVLDAFTDYVEARTGWGKGALHATYYNDEAAALASLNGANRPKWGILSLPIYLKWKKAGTQMQLVAQSELDKKPTMQFHLLVPKDSKITSLETLEGAHVATSYLEDRQFGTKVVFAGKVNCESAIAIVDTKMMGTALSYCSRFRLLKNGQRIDALLVDDEQLNGLQGKRAEFAKMHVVWTSEALPTPPVVRFGAADSAQEQKLLNVLQGMTGNAPGRKILEDLTTSGFQAPNVNAYAAVEKLY